LTSKEDVGKIRRAMVERQKVRDTGRRGGEVPRRSKPATGLRDPQGNGTGKKVAVGSQNSPVAGRKLSTGGQPLGGWLMRGTATATGRTFEVAVPTLRREDAGDG